LDACRSKATGISDACSPLARPPLCADCEARQMGIQHGSGRCWNGVRFGWSRWHWQTRWRGSPGQSWCGRRIIEDQRPRPLEHLQASRRHSDGLIARGEREADAVSVVTEDWDIAVLSGRGWKKGAASMSDMCLEPVGHGPAQRTEGDWVSSNTSIMLGPTIVPTSSTNQARAGKPLS
jgi:hypothetical protein